jgi:hypothetical protein
MQRVDFKALSYAAEKQQEQCVHRPEGQNAPCRNLQLMLDFRAGRISMYVSPPIQFRVEWADSQGMSPLLGCRPI